MALGTGWEGPETPGGRSGPFHANGEAVRMDLPRLLDDGLYERRGTSLAREFCEQVLVMG